MDFDRGGGEEETWVNLDFHFFFFFFFLVGCMDDEECGGHRSSRLNTREEHEK